MMAGKTTVDNRQKLTYNYDNNGNVINLTDAVNGGQQQCFQYNYLNRLTAAFTGDVGCGVYIIGASTGTYSHSYGYNAIGNLTSYAGNSYTYGDAAHKHAVTAAIGNTYSYDANGNQTSRNIGGTVSTFTYDYENRLTAISGGATASFVYDADGNRVKSTVGGVTTVYIAGVFEFIENGATNKMTTYYDGNAMRRSGYGIDDGVFYLLQDHLKSSSSFVNQSGATFANNYYYPYGGNRGGAFSNLTTKRFTGQYHESSLPGGEGLSYYNARWYDPKLGRFLSADTIVPGPNNPQAFNRYSYVLNNPLKYIDPTGHCIAKGQDGHGTAQNQLCLGYAGFIYNDGLANPDTFEAKWRVSPDAWWKNIGEQPGLDANFMKPHFDQAFDAFCARSGLTCHSGDYVENTPPTSSSSGNAIVLGVGFSGSVAVVSVSGGLEILIHENGVIALYGSRSFGLGLGAGGALRFYQAFLSDLPNARGYAGWATAKDSTMGPIVAGTVESVPDGAHGGYFGLAVGAKMSGSLVVQKAPSAYIIFNVATGDVSSPYLEETIASFRSLSR